MMMMMMIAFDLLFWNVHQSAVNSSFRYSLITYPLILLYDLVGK